MNKTYTHSGQLIRPFVKLNEAANKTARATPTAIRN